MRHFLGSVLIVLGTAVSSVHAYIEAPYSLGQVCNESTNIVLVEVAKVNKDKNLIIFKKVQDIKGKHPQQEIKHNIGQNGKHEREWKNVMAWAEVGKRAVFFHNGSASETCIGTYWYQCYPEGEWWAMSHAEPYLLRTYFGDVDRLAAAVVKMLEGNDTIVPCLADGNLDQLHERKGKVQRFKASVKRGNYDAKRDFVAFGTGDDGVELKTVMLLARSSEGWKFLPAQDVAATGERWRQPDLNDKDWRSGRTPVGYGKDEIPQRKGTVVAERAVPFVFRREIDVPADLLNHKGVTFQIGVSSRDSAIVYVNGAEVDKDPSEKNVLAYWNRELDLPANKFKAGRNVIAVYVKSHKDSSHVYFDLEVSAEYPLTTAPLKVAAKETPGSSGQDAPKEKPVEDKEIPGTMTVDKEKRTVTIACTIAPRKLPNLADIYPIEVIACYPAPRGQKAHETVVTFAGVKPSSVHKALEQLGLKPGMPAVGMGKKAEGPELKIFLEFTGADGKAQRIPIEQTMVDRKTEKPIAALKWHFTGSVMKQPDPEKDEKVYGADLTGTLMTLLPVTNETVIQSSLTAEDEPAFKLETNKAALPKEGKPAKLIIEVK
jgi:hypothetical protein